MAPKKCTIACVFCLSTQYKNPSISLHSFPKDQSRRSLWLTACGLTEDDYKPSRKLCSQHFDQDCFKTGTTLNILKPNSVPTKFNKHSKEFFISTSSRKNMPEMSSPEVIYPLDDQAVSNDEIETVSNGEMETAYYCEIETVSNCEMETVHNCGMETSQMYGGGEKNTKITEAIVYFICKDNQPFSVVEDIGFVKLMKEVAPLYKVPTRNTVKAQIFQKYDVISSNFRCILNEIKDITVTTNIWSEMMTIKSFLGVSIHFIYLSKLCSATLGIFELSKLHTASYISDELLNVLNLWNIPKSKILAVVTDNDSTMLKAIKENFGENKHLQCFAHSINLVAEGSIKKVNGLIDLISKVRNIVKFIKRSVNCSDELRQFQEKDGNNFKKLILDVVTRWNSVYYMCKRFLELKEVINQIVLQHIVDAPPMLNAQDIENIKQVVNILEILEKVTSEISGQKYATMSLVIPIISCINNKLSTMLPTSRIGVELKTALTAEMKKRFEFTEQNNLLSVSTILDPRFKNIHFKDSLELSKHLRFINSSINSMVRLEEDNHSTDSGSTSESGTIDLWGHHKQLAQKSLKKYVDKTNIGNQKHLGPEITMYLSTPVSQLKTDPLISWEELKPMYPLMYKLALKYLSGVCTSVPSEELFSCASNTISKTRSRLSGKSASKLIFLRNLDDQFWP